MGRGLAFGRTAWPGVGEVLLGSTHLESFVGEEQRQQVLSSRQAQLREAASLLEREARRHGCVAAVLIGDMNWNDEDGDPLRATPPSRPPQACVPFAPLLLSARPLSFAGELGAGWADAWEAVGRPKAASTTMWKFRLDRCFVLSLGSHGGGRTLGDGGGGGSGGGGAGAVRAASVTLVGKDKIPGEWYEHHNKYTGQTQCAASLSIITCPCRAPSTCHPPSPRLHFLVAGEGSCPSPTTAACSCSSRQERAVRVPAPPPARPGRLRLRGLWSSTNPE